MASYHHRTNPRILTNLIYHPLVVWNLASSRHRTTTDNPRNKESTVVPFSSSSIRNQPKYVTTTTTTTTTCEASQHLQQQQQQQHYPLTPTILHPNTTKDIPTTTTSTIKEYDFVIIGGNGNAGRMAHHTIQKECPQASIAIIDPTTTTNSISDTTTTDYYPHSVLHLDPSHRMLHVSNHNNNNSHNHNKNNNKVSYKHALLIATGARGAPIPSYLIDNDIDRKNNSSTIVELRPQQQPSASTTTSSSEQVRALLLQTIQNNHNNNLEDPPKQIAILGSGWEAIELAAAAAAATTAAHQFSSYSYSYSYPLATLIFGNRGPVASIVPQYLSAAITKKLKTKRIHVQDRCIVRYIAATSQQTQTHTNRTTIELHTAKSYDLLDSQQFTLDVLIAAPDVKGPMGTAVLATHHVPEFLKFNNEENRFWYQNWSHLSTPPPSPLLPDKQEEFGTPIVCCYKDDGRIVVNNELCASTTGIYAAGSCSKYPNIRTGNSEVAGFGYEDGKQAGYVAGMNMSLLYHKHKQQQQQQQKNHQTKDRWISPSSFLQERETKEREGKEEEPSLLLSYLLKTNRRLVKDPIPIWRSDVISYIVPNATTSHGDSGDQEELLEFKDEKMRSSLSQIGIRALCVGNCDSETCATRAWWWTNQAAQQRLKRMVAAAKEDSSSSSAVVVGKKRTTHSGGRPVVPRRKTGFTSVKPVYGYGVIYYVSSSGRIQGVMTWGLPFTLKDGNSLNRQLTERMKAIITGSDEICDDVIDGNEKDRIRLHSYLEEESKKIVALALRGRAKGDRASSHQLDCSSIEDFPKPLYRYTDVRPPEIRNVRVLKRKDGESHGKLGEDLFSQREYMLSKKEPIPKLKELFFDEQQTSPSSASSSSTSVDAMNNWMLWKRINRYWDENELRARPPKEELLWVRKGDENKNMSARDRLKEAYFRVWKTR